MVIQYENITVQKFHQLKVFDFRALDLIFCKYIVFTLQSFHSYLTIGHRPILMQVKSFDMLKSYLICYEYYIDFWLMIYVFCQFFRQNVSHLISFSSINIINHHSLSSLTIPKIKWLRNKFLQVTFTKSQQYWVSICCF